MTMTPLSIDYVDEHTRRQFHLPLSVFRNGKRVKTIPDWKKFLTA